MELTKTFRFEASHILPHHPGKCSNLHGHSWVLHVAVQGPVDETTGMVMDYGDIKKAVQPIIDDLDHAHLGAWNTQKIDIFSVTPGPWKPKRVEWLKTDNPTSENLLLEIARQLIKTSFVFSELILQETADTYCSITWQEYQDFEARWISG